MTQQEVYKAILGQGGALILACLVLYNVMSSYETLIDTMIQDSKEDRAMYIDNMNALSEHIDTLNNTLQQIQSDIAEIKKIQSSKK